MLFGAPFSPPAPARGLLQVFVGLLVGMKVSRDSLRAGFRSLAPAAVLAVATIGVGILSALLAARLTGIDQETALFAAIPGGLAQMSTLAASLGVDGAAVVAVHLARVLVVVAIVGALLGRFEKAKAGSAPPEGALGGRERPGAGAFGLAVLLGSAFGLLGLLSPVPAGGALGAMAGSAVVAARAEGVMPTGWLMLPVQVLGGAIIGLGLSTGFFGALVPLAGVAAITITAQLLLWLATSRLLAGLLRYDAPTAAFAAAPGGMGEIVSAIHEDQANTTVVAFTHLVRLSAIVAFVPSLIALVLTG
jgi:membrane AbrB-like protein